MSEELDFEKELQAFFKNNPKSKIGTFYIDSDEPFQAITKPWNDPSLALRIDDKGKQFLKLLNNCELPERVSGIFHLNSGDLEVLWAAYKLTDVKREIFGRSFNFRYNSRTYKCEFGTASKLALDLGEQHFPLQPSDTNFRNLESFKQLQVFGSHDNLPFGDPSSFWIRNLNLRDDELIVFLRHLNFYLSYFDEKSPTVIIHPPDEKQPTNKDYGRYPHGYFPKEVNSCDFASEVLQFWIAAQAGDASQRFLLYFRIIEHVSRHYVDAAPREAVKRALMMPHALDDLNSCTEKIIQAVQHEKLDDYNRFMKVVRDFVEPDLIWPIIEANIDSFSQIQVFDGGFATKSIIAGKESKSDFKVSGYESFCRQVREIRNALSHGKEQKTAAVIIPTKANFVRLVPWSNALRRVAGEVIVYSNATK